MSKVSFEENYIRRERRRKAETKKAIEEMRAALPLYNIDEVRQHKLPYHEALLIGLEEKGYMCTTAYIKQLLDFQNDLREKAGPQSVVWSRPQLISSDGDLKLLADALVASEQYHNKENYAKECDTFLRIAVHFAFVNEGWWWLGEQLLVQSIDVSSEYTFLGGKYEALSRFIYAKFLLETVLEYKSAMEQLEKVRELSNGRRWTSGDIIPHKDTLFAETNRLLFHCLMREAQYLMTTDFQKARGLTIIARKRAAEACYYDGETKAYLLKAICEMGDNDAKSAIESCKRAYLIQEKLGCAEGICETRIQLAQAYLMNGDTLLSLKTLVLAREMAELHHIYFYLAQAYRYLGEFYLNNGEPETATPLLADALEIFHTGGYLNFCEQVRNLEAISIGLEFFPKFLKFLSKTNHPVKGIEYLLKLVDWKDSRTSYWDDDEPSFSSASIHVVTPEEEEEEEDREIASEEVQDESGSKSILELHVHENSLSQSSGSDQPSTDSETDIKDEYM